MSDDVEEVIETLRDGGLAIFATDTLWSLSALAFDPEAATAIFAEKRRPEGVPLAVGFPSWGMAKQYVEVTPLAERLSKHLPGPISLVLKRRGDQLAHVAPGYETISIRVPDDEDALEILDRVGPCIMTSANRHGQEDLRTRSEIDAAFPHLPAAGTAVKGIGSTVVDATGDEPVILRQGALRVDRILA